MWDTKSSDLQLSKGFLGTKTPEKTTLCLESIPIYGRRECLLTMERKNKKAEMTKTGREKSLRWRRWKTNTERREVGGGKDQSSPF